MNQYKFFRTLHDAGGLPAVAWAGYFLVKIGAGALSILMVGLALWICIAWYHEVVLADDPKADVGTDAVYRYVEAVLFTGIFVFALFQGIFLLAGMMVLAIFGAAGLGWLGGGASHMKTVLKKSE